MPEGRRMSEKVEKEVVEYEEKVEEEEVEVGEEEVEEKEEDMVKEEEEGERSNSIYRIQQLLMIDTLSKLGIERSYFNPTKGDL